MEYPKIGIILVNWNGLADSLECLASLQKVSYPNYQIILVDNGSVDASTTRIPELYPDILFIPTGKNLGWAGGNNVGIQEAQKHNCEYLFLLNNDTVVEPDCLNKLVQAAHELGPSLLHPALYYYDEPHIPQLDPSYGSPPPHPPVIPMNHAYGAALFVHASIFKKIGLFDERFFLQLEETDFYYRAARQDFKAFCITNTKVFHKVSRSFGGRISPLKTYYTARNSLLIFFKHPRAQGSLLMGIKNVLWQFQTLAAFDTPKISPSTQISLGQLFLRLFAQNPFSQALRYALADFLQMRFGMIAQSKQRALQKKPN